MEYNELPLVEVVNIKTGKLNSNAAIEDGAYPFFTCAPEPLRIDGFKYDQAAILLAGNNAEGNFHINYYEGKFEAYQRTYIIDSKDAEKYDLKYVFYALKECLYDFKLMSQGTSTKFLTMAILNSFKLKIPSIEVQRKISGVLSTIDEKIENNTSINRNLSEQTAALYKSWFVDYEPFNGEQPLDWTEGTVDDLAKEVVCGKTPSTKKEEYYGEDIPFVTIPDMHGCVYTVQTERKLSILGAESQSKKTLPKNSICVSCIGTAGLVTLLPEPSQTNQQINSIVPKTDYSAYYIYLMMDTMGETINKLGQAGSTIVNLNKTQFGKMEVLIPSVKAMRDFDEIVEPMFNAILSNQIENIRLAKLRDSLLPKLMSGKLDISDLDI